MSIFLSLLLFRVQEEGFIRNRMDVKIGDLYIRNSNGKTYVVKKIDNTMVVLQSLEDEGRLAISDIFSLQKGYKKKEEHGQ